MMSTHTYVTMSVSEATYTEIENKLKSAQYDHAFHKDGRGKIVIDMHGLALEKEATTVQLDTAV